MDTKSATVDNVISLSRAALRATQPAAAVARCPVQCCQTDGLYRMLLVQSLAEQQLLRAIWASSKGVAQRVHQIYLRGR